MISLDPTFIGILGFVAFISLVIIGVPIGIGMGLVGFLGIVLYKGFPIALNTLFMVPYSATASWLLSVIPMFILMGNIAFYAGFTKDAYNAAYKWVGRFPGGLSVATLMGAAAFGACSGSSIAATAALGRLALPEMKRYGYNRSLAAGVVAMGGTLSALIPPSILLVIYGVITEESISKLLIAGIIPGVLSMALFAVLVVLWAKIRPAHAPRGESFSRRERLASLKDVIGILLLFICVTGGIYSGLFTPTEAGAVGAFIILIMALAMKRLNKQIFKEIVLETLRVVSSIFLIVLGAYIFIQFLSLTRLPVNFAEWVIGLHVDRIIIIIGTVAVYLILGCFLDALGLILLTVPFISTAISGLGFDLIWFGVIVVKLVEIGLLT
ncbi:MAG: TRAP transporter large permease subunit, partial [Deltaproteobacteria bacterium]|nr:TRAP transporter large permease subunit [Deltaproteobacteria bacterium]